MENDSSPGEETRESEVNEEERSVETVEQVADEEASRGSDDGSDEKEQEEEQVGENEEEKDENSNEEVEEEEDAEKPAEDEVEKDSDDEEFAGFEEEDISSKAKKRQIVSDDESDAEEKEADPRLSAEDSDNDEVVNDEDEEEHDHKRSKKKKHKKHHDENQDSNEAGHTDLEKALAKQKADNRKRHRKKNMDSEEITDVENTVAAIITEMKNVAMDDRIANEKSTPAIQKLKLLPTVVDFLKKSDYHATMIEMGILGAIAEWLAPLPDKSLPNIKIREEMIDALKDFGEINADYLKSSGVGKAVMFLYKHPKEVKSNKQKLEKLIHNWSRPIFNVDSNFKHLTKEERMQRDMEHVKTLNRRNSDETGGDRARVDDFLAESRKSKRQGKHGEEKSDSEDPNKLLRPGEAGFIPRARVPVPSAKDYIIRPKSNVDSMEIAQKAKKSESRIDKHTKRFLEIKKSGRFQRAVTMKIGGKD